MSVTTARRGVRAPRRRWSLGSVLIALVLFAGVVTVLYPTTADWFAARMHATEVSGYVNEVEQLPSTARQAMLDDARRYNDLLPDGPLRDPYTLMADGSAQSVEEGRDDYEGVLDFGDGAAMARIRIPSIGVDLPVYHGTDTDTLDRGVGHLYGSSLPVGGPGTHAVLTGHSGLPSATLFTGVHDMAEGDVFYIDVAGETLTYQVDRISTVTPDSGEELRKVAGVDYVTLLTCTPIGVNTHRLLVRGVRIPTVENGDGAQRFGANAADPGFPWWAVGLVAAGVVSVWVARPAPAPRPRRGEEARP